MLLAAVVGHVWGARQAESLQGHRLLVVRPLTRQAVCGRAGQVVLGQEAAEAPLRRGRGGTLVVADRLGAGPGELVLVAHGSRCRDLTLGEHVATKEVTIAIVDGAELRASAAPGGVG